MRVVVLSDHPGEMLREVREERQASAGRTGGRWLSRLVGVFTGWLARGEARRRPAGSGARSAEEEIIAAGVTGERKVANDLGRALDDDWVLMSGYRNGGGEIDHVLLGPRGLFAIEVKYRNATVFIDGDTWRYDKYDVYGNHVEQGRITDARGRSPSMQVNAAADELEKFLRSRRKKVAVQRAVILAHPRSRLGSQRHPTVFATTSTDAFLRMLTASQDRIKPGDRTEVTRLIEQDHRFHAARRARS